MNPRSPRNHSVLKNGGWCARLVPALLCLAVLTGCSMLPQEEETLAPPLKVPEQVTYETLEVKKGTIERKLRATGRFMSVAQANAQFTEQGGRLEAIHVKIGEIVKKGDLLATLDVASLADDIRLQEIALERAQIAQERLKKQLAADAAMSDPALAPATVEANRIRGVYDLELAALDVETNRLRLTALKREIGRASCWERV